MIMIQAAEEITDKLIGAVKADKPFYTINELRSAGYPNFITQSLGVAVFEKIKNELTITSSLWINWQNQYVQDSWKDFSQAAKANLIIPKASLYSLTKDVIHKILQIYLQPRKNLADFIYAEQTELSYSEMIARLSNLSVHKHFGRAIPLYMQKRKLQSLEKNRCRLLIQKLDTNLAVNYNIDDWLESLDLLFLLGGGKIHSGLLAQYFEDKEFTAAEKAIKDLNEKISQTRLRSILERLEDEKPDLLEEVQNQDSGEGSEKNLMDSFSENYNDEEATEDGSINALFKDQPERSIFADFEDEEDDPDLKQENNRNESGAFHKNLTSVLDMAADSFRHLSGEEPDEAESKQENPSENKKAKNDESDSSKEEGLAKVEDEPDENIAEESEEPVIWQQFMSKEQRETLLWTSDDNQQDDKAILLEDEELIDEDFIEEQPPFADLNYKTETLSKQDEDLRVFLMGQEVYFIEEIFGGSEEKYSKTLDKIIDFENWDNASEFIQTKVFTKHKVDMYSEAAVDFIDQLQSYFQEYKN